MSEMFIRSTLSKYLNRIVCNRSLCFGPLKRVVASKKSIKNFFSKNIGSVRKRLSLTKTIDKFKSIHKHKKVTLENFVLS